ncbi:MAG: hypothetical protein JO257_13325 [Deltaproteobacteria bacterium]|nr:hypothetical protein [Deltaproteobacteria bacterium]
MFSRTGGVFARGCVAVVIAACSSSHPPPPPAPVVEAKAPPHQTLVDLHKQHGALLLVTEDKSIGAFTPELERVGTVTNRTGHDGVTIKDTLYALGDRQLFEVDLATGDTHVLATLPPLHHKCITTDDPTASLRDGSFPAIDRTAGTACIHVQDRNDNMASVSIDYKIDLKTGKSEHRTTMALDECREPGEPKDGPSLCSAGYPQVPPDQDTQPHSLKELGKDFANVSASRRWAVITDDALAEEGDYIYHAPMLFDGTTAKTYAITPAGAVPIDFKAAVAARKLPDGACYSPGEAQPQWLPNIDVLLVPGCGDGTLVLAPGKPPKTLQTQQFVVW